LKNVAFDQIQAFLRDGCRELLAKVVNEDRVDFDRNQLLCASQQYFGQCATAGTDLNDQRRAFVARSFCDVLKNRLAGQEVLAESSTQTRLSLHFDVADPEAQT
jgi:hypothetical protein